MKKINSDSIHHFLKATILLGFAVYILYLMLTGEILQFIVPKLVLYVQIADFFLFVIALFQFYVAVKSIKKKVVLCNCGDDHDGHDHNHHHGHLLGHGHHGIFKKSIAKDTFIYSLFLLPLLLAFLPSQSLSSSLVETRGMNLGSVANNAKGGPAVELAGDYDPVIKALFKANVYDQDYARLGMNLYQETQIEMKDEWFIEKLKSMNMFVDNFQEKEIKIKGFVYREEGLASNQFIIARMGMTHCIADISPFGIIAESASAEQFTNDSWYTITGKISKTEYNGLTVIKINVISSEPAEEPKVQYVYPDWDFGKKL